MTTSPSTSARETGAAPKEPLTGLQQRFAALRAINPHEYKQARVRMAVYLGFAAYIYTLDRVGGGATLYLPLMALVSVGTCLGLFAWLLWRPQRDGLRRGAGITLDLGFASTAMAFAGEAGALYYAVLLWVVLANGLRFGRAYLHFAQALAVAGFLAVIYFNDYWQAQPTLALAMLLVLIAVPMYLAAIVSQLHAASARAEAASMAKTRFLAAASHDLRQPMQALSMYSSVLEQRVGGGDALRIVRGIQLSVTTLEQLFDGLLDISRIEAGAVKPNVAAFPLLPLLERVVRADAGLAAQKGLELKLAPTSAIVMSDPLLLERMLKNLVTNAIRYTERGRIVVGCRRLGAHRVRIDVIDSGVGIEPAEQQRIFEEYYQVSGAHAQGLGLGLPIVKSMADLLGHRIAVRSAPGRGSTFSIELARVRSFSIQPHTERAAFERLDGLVVAVVDDDAEIRASLKLLLESWGCRCFTGASGQELEAELALASESPDALITDYRLAGPETGLQVIQRVRERFGATLPALLITGTAHASLVQDAAGRVPVAVKPVAPGKLRAFVSQSARVRPRYPQP